MMRLPRRPNDGLLAMTTKVALNGYEGAEYSGTAELAAGGEQERQKCSVGSAAGVSRWFIDGGDAGG